MSIATSDLGVLGNLAIALGVFTPEGEPDPAWFGDPGRALGRMLANQAQREALIAFVDEALGGADRSADPRGVLWLPIVELRDPALTIAVTMDDRPAEGIHLGLGLRVRTTGPGSESSLAIPLFRVWREGGPTVSDPLLLGSRGGRIRIATSITIDDSPPTPGAARLGSIGVEVDLPTAPGDPQSPVFGLSLGGFQLPGAPQPRDIRVSADGVDEVDDALLDLILSLVKSQADQAGADPLLASLAGLLGLREADDIPDFPIRELVATGPGALADWLYGVVTAPASRAQWIGYLATLLGATAAGDAIAFTLGGAARVAVELGVDTGPSGHALLTPRLGVELGDASARVMSRADLFTVDLVTGSTIALPRLGLWVAAGTNAQPVLDVTAPTVAHADTLRIGFALDAQRRLIFDLAADGVVLGAHSYPTLDLTSPDAVMDAVGNTVGDVAEQLLAGAGDALAVVRAILGLDPPAGVPAVQITALMTDPVAAVSDYWQALLAAGGAQAREVLEKVRDALADAGSATSPVSGGGTADDPWRVPLEGPLGLELWTVGDVLSIGVAATVSDDSLGQRCTVLETRFAATIAAVDLVRRGGSVLCGVEARLSARERGASPPRVRLELGDGVALVAGGVGLRMGWAPAAGFGVDVHIPGLGLEVSGELLPVALPTVAADGTVSLPEGAWDAVEMLVGYFGGVVGGYLADVVNVLGWASPERAIGGTRRTAARLRLALLVTDPAAALRDWLPQLALSDAGHMALLFVADLFRGSGANRGVITGSGHPDDPYCFELGDGLPQVAVWFPPAGLERDVIAAPAALQQWRPGMPGLDHATLAAALAAEASVAADVRDLVAGRDVAGGLAALAARWVGTDGRIVPPDPAPAGIVVDRSGLAARQLLDQLDLEGLTGRVPTTTVLVAVGRGSWPDAPADRVVDLAEPRLTAAMMQLPAAATGEWYVELATRADALVPGSTTDGTPEQAARLARLLEALAPLDGDMAIVAVGGAGHAARVAADGQPAVADLVMVGTPLGPISLTAVSAQPAADALRLLDRLLPAPDATDAGGVDVGGGEGDDGVDDPDAEPLTEPEDDDLALGRALVGALMALTGKEDPGIELRMPTAPAPAVRAGLTVTALFGQVSAEQVSRAITAIVAAGLAGRARARVLGELAGPTGVRAGLRFALAPFTTGALDVSGDATLTLFSYDLDGGVRERRRLRIRLRVADRAGWLSATPELELRMVTVDVELPLDTGTADAGGEDTGGAADMVGTTAIHLHDARVFGQSWERLTIGTGDGAVPVLPEARVLLSAALQRVRADAAGAGAAALTRLLTALGIADAAGALVGDALDQLVHDPVGLVRERMAAGRADVSAAVAELLGPVADGADMAARSIRVSGGDAAAGRFGWHADVTAGVSGLSGELRFGGPGDDSPAGGLECMVGLDPFAITLHWHRANGTTSDLALWPSPDAGAIGRLLADIAPSLGAQAALELMREAADDAAPVVDAALDALGLLSGSAGDARRAVRPMAALVADPAAWLRSNGSLAASPARIQGLFDALRPLLGIPGAAGEPIPLAPGVALGVAPDGAGARLSLSVDPTAWTAPGAIAGRLAAGLDASLTISPTDPPTAGVAAHLGLAGAAPGRRAVHLELGGSGVRLFMRPAAGADISLVPFAGVGSLAAAAEMALPFLLDELSRAPDPVGPVVATLGDALALRAGTPGKFDSTALHAWALDPVGSLTRAVPSIVGTGLTVIAPLVDDLVPAGVYVTADASSLTVTVGAFSLAWNPTLGAVRVAGDGVSVPGMDELSFALGVGPGGLDELTLTAGPARVPAGGVTLRPFVTLAAGNAPVGGRRVAVGLALDDSHRFAARWLLDSGSFAVIASDGAPATAVESADPAVVALRVVEVMADLVAAVAMAQQPVRDLLDTDIGSTHVRDVLRGVVLADAANPAALLPGVFDPATILARVGRLFSNLAGADISITVDPLVFTIHENAEGIVGIGVALSERMELSSGDVTLWLENDGSWIDGNAAGLDGLFVGFLRLPAMVFEPALTVYGLGLRIGRASGPLLDAGITLDSLALHAYAEIAAAGARGGGVQLQFSNLAVPLAGAGGDNGVAQGVMNDTGPTPPRPAFSPALAVQKHGNAPVSVSLRAGDGTGPWWIAIQRGFGPLYVEQVGFGSVAPQGRLESVSVLLDGSVSLFGLTAAVDDLRITYFTSAGDLFDPRSWAVDLGGLAVSADMAGVSIAGGLLRRTSDAGIEYLGMLLGRFGVYGITIFGGFGEGVQDGQRFTAFFAVGAVNGPIGGVPAFFLTGIGGGFGINRKLVVPTDLSRFGDYPLIQALDVAAQPQDPMAQLRALGDYFPMRRGTFWFAAGLAFNSFALVDGIAVVAVEIGDGLDITLLGLARMALPRPQAAIVSIELALMVRFSSSEGVLWVQGQLTDNSWLLYRDVKLTGGFAYVIWFGGEHRGEFVLTLGGYHPDFHRDGYPQVPRLGLRWSIGSNIVITAGGYFALCSEAVMAGGDFEVSARLGPAWAELRFGAHGIVFFDPFHYDVSAYCQVAAGVTINTWIFGKITISVHTGARVKVSGPEFHGTATFDVGPVELTVSFGGSDRVQLQPLAPDVFITKYLEAAATGGAEAHALVTSFGALPARAENATPDGSSARPFVVVVEFGLTFTSTIPATKVTRSQAASGGVTQHAPSRALGVAPMIVADVQPELWLEWRRGGAAQSFPFATTPRPFGSFPVGVWGAPQDPNDRRVPKGEMVEALSSLDLSCVATPTAGGPEIPYYQVEIGRRKPLPFSRKTTAARAVSRAAKEVADLLTAPATVAGAYDVARKYMKSTASPTAIAALRGDRSSPPLPGSLAERIEVTGRTEVPDVGGTRPSATYDHFVDPPVAIALLPGAAAKVRVSQPTRTTVKGSERAWRRMPPTLAQVEAERSRSIAARLTLTDPPAATMGREGPAIALQGVPPTITARGTPALVANPGSPAVGRLGSFTAGMVPRSRGQASRAAADAGANPGASLLPGETVVMRLPNAERDTALDVERPRLVVDGSPARVVILASGGAVLADRIVGGGRGATEDDQAIVVARGAERIAAVGGVGGDDPGVGLSGWHSGSQLPYLGWSTALAPGCVVRSTMSGLARHRERAGAGWIAGAELAAGVNTVTTTFSEPPRTVVVMLDDPAAFGDPVAGRQLLLGLDGARRATDADGNESPPMLLTMENRSVLAYDVVPDMQQPVVVTVATQEGWSLVGVMGSVRLDATGAIALISARGLDAAVRPFSTATSPDAVSQLRWDGPTRTPEQRSAARSLASRRPPMSVPVTRKSRSAKATKAKATKAKATSKGTTTRTTTAAKKSATTKKGAATRKDTATKKDTTARKSTTAKTAKKDTKKTAKKTAKKDTKKDGTRTRRGEGRGS